MLFWVGLLIIPLSSFTCTCTPCRLDDAGLSPSLPSPHSTVSARRGSHGALISSKSTTPLAGSRPTLLSPIVSPKGAPSAAGLPDAAYTPGLPQAEVGTWGPRLARQVHATVCQWHWGKVAPHVSCAFYVPWQTFTFAGAGEHGRASSPGARAGRGGASGLLSGTARSKSPTPVHGE